MLDAPRVATGCKCEPDSGNRASTDYLAYSASKPILQRDLTVLQEDVPKQLLSRWQGEHWLLHQREFHQSQLCMVLGLTAACLPYPPIIPTQASSPVQQPSFSLEPSAPSASRTRSMSASAVRRPSKSQPWFRLSSSCPCTRPFTPQQLRSKRSGAGLAVRGDQRHVQGRT